MLTFVFAAVILTVVCAQDSGVVYLFDPSGKSGVAGNVTFTKTSNGIQISGEVHGLTEGKHGFHVHKLGHIAPGCLGTGGHFNPHNAMNVQSSSTNRNIVFNPHIKTFGMGTDDLVNILQQNHGAPEDKVRHVGDLGNIVADNTGVAQIKIVDNVIALDGPNCIIGRAVVVHEKEDDLGKGGNSDSLVTGNAGGRVACGVIGIQSESAAVGIFTSTTLLASLLILVNVL